MTSVGGQEPALDRSLEQKFLTRTGSDVRMKPAFGDQPGAASHE